MIRYLGLILVGTFSTGFLTPSYAGEIEEVLAISERYNLENEVRLSDGTRVDLLSSLFAIEADWSEKWAEGIGQSLYYALRTGKKPGILLIRKREQDKESHKRFLARCEIVCQRYEISLWESTEGDSTVSLVYPPKGPF